jgi:hypothetical protein
VNPLSRFIKGFSHGYATQRDKRVKQETLTRQLKEARRVENQAATLKIGNRVMTASEINFELDRGSRFVVFQYCISIIFRTYKHTSKIYLVKSGDSVTLKGLPFTMIASLLGMWGIPWGPIWTIESIFLNFDGGRNITDEVVTSLNAALPTLDVPR